MPRHSLKGKKNIQAILNIGKRYISERLVLCFSPDIPVSEKDYGVAFLISASSGGAVDRNKIKRWLREDFRCLQKENGVAGAFVIKFKGKADRVNHERLSGELAKLYNSVSGNG